MASATYVLLWDALPPSMNNQASGYRSHHMKAHQAKQTWEGVCMVMLLQRKVPKQLERVRVTAEMIVPDKRRRDAGNYRMLIEKCLGDTLVKGGWLLDDTPDRYLFGELKFVHSKGERGMRLTLEVEHSGPPGQRSS